MKRNLGFILLTVALFLITGCSMGGVARCQPKQRVQVNEEYYEQLEAEYVEETRRLLEEAGLKNAGLMLTHVREADGRRTYTLDIHHRYYSYLNREMRGELMASLEKCGFERENCTFVVCVDGM